MYCHLESKSSSAFNFIEKLALELCTNSHNLIIEWRNIWRHKQDITDAEKKETQMKSMRCM